MKFSIITILILFVVTFCVPKQIKQEENRIDKDNSKSTAYNLDSNGAIIQEDANTTTKISEILGVPYYRIDSLKTAGRKIGGRSESDSSIAMFLRLKDSVRIIGSHLLGYDGQFFAKRDYDKKDPLQLNCEIMEESRGIVSVQKRMRGKPSYFPLLDQKIEFYNHNNKLINTFSLNNSNPFLKDKSKKVIEHRFPPPDDRSAFLSGQDLKWKNHVHKYYSYNRFNVQENGYVIVEYILYAIDANEGILKSISTLVVLDSTGKEYCRFNELESMFHYYWIVSGGKYLMVNGGGILGEGFQRLEQSFLKIYDVRSKKWIYEELLENDGDDYSDFFESESPHKISVSFGSYKKTEENRFTELIFDLDARKRCMKVISQTDWNRVTNERIIYSGNVWLREFDFECKTF